LQIEGEVIHVIVERCFDISKLLKRLTPSESHLPNVATFAFPDKSAKTIVRNLKTFTEVRNFK
jgi:error-prone DNA polymerase